MINDRQHIFQQQHPCDLRFKSNNDKTWMCYISDDGSEIDLKYNIHPSFIIVA